jgi:hypothetical protein
MYDLENDTTTEPWTSTLNLLDILQSHYEATLDILQQRTREFGSAMDDERAPFGADSANLLMGADEDANGVSSDKSQWLHHTLKDQLIELVEKSLAMMRERMTFLERWVAPIVTFF